jgi:hypothetical protein
MKIETRQQLASLLGDPLEWKRATFVDDFGGNQTVFLCPRCSAVVADPRLHAAWHIEAL